MNLIQMTFPGGKRRAFTTSYDDGVLQDKRLIKIMNQYGIKGTFNLNSGFLGRCERAVIDGFDTDISTLSEQEIEKAYEGHEIAAHALTHLKLTDIDTAVAAYQIVEDRKNLEGITGQIISGFAYPFGTYDEKVIEALRVCGIDYARTVENTSAFDLPKEFLAWHPTCHHNDEQLMALAERFCNEEALFGKPQLFYLWGHAYEFDQRDNWDRIEELFQYISQHKEQIWLATNQEIVDYIRCFKQLKYSAVGDIIYNPCDKDVWLAMDHELVCIPAGKRINIAID